MSRILIVIISILGSVMLYLCLRVFKKYNITPRVQNAVMFLPVAVIFGLWAYITGENIRVGRDILLLMIPMYALFSWLANLMSLKSMQVAPNIGYSLMISKSYVVIAALGAVPLLGSVLTVRIASHFLH